ncbi:MAG: DUF4438 domain-containing protein [Candidatus Aminicenantes bacterium]|nr:DUF4438 domain-containing protein [Candidatus Aminicenantes bacterium]
MKIRHIGLFAVPVLVVALLAPTMGKGAPDEIKTNKDKVLVTAVQGRIAEPQPSRGYLVTWDGKPKMAVGTGGINYNLKIGDPVFGWAAGDRATVGVATEPTGESRYGASWLTHSSLGNEVRILSGEARGKKGVVVGKFGGYVLVHFDDGILDKLTLGDSLHIKASGLGLEIDGFPDVFVHSLAPELLEKLEIRLINGQLEVPVVKEIPAEIMGQGSGGGSLFGNWHIQTCHPPDIEKYGLADLRFGDLVLLMDTQTDYGRGYYRGGATIGVVCGGPSDLSGMGIGVTPILSTRFGKITGRIDPAANIRKFLGLTLSKRDSGSAPAGATARSGAGKNPGALKTNAASLIVTAVDGVVQPTSGRDYSVTYDGRPWLDVGMASINYNVSLGDPTYGWAQGDHVEPDVTIQGRDRPNPSECALAVLACIGNEAEVVSGEARGGKGYYIGRHAGSDDKVWFPKDVVEKLTLNDRIQVKAKGVGLKIEGFEDVRLNKMSPELLAKLGITIEGDQLVVPIAMEVPGYLMGSGLGGPGVEYIDYDIQTTCPEVVEELGLKRLRLGDVVAIRDHYDYWGRGRYEGAVTIGTVIHGFSEMAGHGPGVNPILSALPGRIKTKIDPHANIAYYLGLRPKPRS